MAVKKKSSRDFKNNEQQAKKFKPNTVTIAPNPQTSTNTVTIAPNPQTSINTVTIDPNSQTSTIPIIPISIRFFPIKDKAPIENITKVTFSEMKSDPELENILDYLQENNHHLLYNKTDASDMSKTMDLLLTCSTSCLKIDFYPSTFGLFVHFIDYLTKNFSTRPLVINIRNNKKNLISIPLTDLFNNLLLIPHIKMKISLIHFSFTIEEAFSIKKFMINPELPMDIYLLFEYSTFVVPIPRQLELEIKMLYLKRIERLKKQAKDFTLNQNEIDRNLSTIPPDSTSLKDNVHQRLEINSVVSSEESKILKGIDNSNFKVDEDLVIPPEMISILQQDSEAIGIEEEESFHYSSLTSFSP